MRNMLIEISAINPATKLNTVVRMSAANATAEGVYLDGKTWLPAITSDPEFALGYWGDGRAQALTVSYGQLNFVLSPKLGNSGWPKLNFDGATATAWVGEMGADFSAYRQIWTGAVGPLVQDSSREAHLSLLGVEAQLNRSILSRTFQGTGGIEGPSTMLGKLKPISFGACVNVAPVLLDPIKFIYQVDAYHAVPISAVYSSALTLDAPFATVGSYAELAALTIPVGKWAACPNAGMFRLGADPGSSKITADIGTPENAASVARRLVKLAGVLDAFVGPSFLTGSRGYSLYLTEDATVGDAVRDAAFAESRLLIADSSGVFHLAPMASAKAPGTLASDGSALPFVRPDTIVQEAPASPAWQVKVGHTPVFSVNGANEISEAVATAGADLTAARKAADDAAAAADAANAAAALAISRLNDAASDGILDRSEKRTWIADFEAATAERDGLVIEGQAQGATAQVQAYSDAYAALNAYLATLNPAFTDTAHDSPIDPATFKARFINYDVAKQNLLNALANKAAQTAHYDQVANRPTNLTMINEAEGDKLGGIESGATVGAPAGTPFGNGTVDDYIIDAEAAATAHLTALANAEITRIRDRALTFPGADGASIYTLHKREETARQTADEAFTEAFELLGAVTPDGNAFVLDDSTVQVTKTEAGATVYQSLSARFADNEGAIEDIKQVFTDENGTLARALLRVDAGGRIVGYAVTNDSRRGDFIVTADRFIIVDPDTGIPYFYADDTGKVVMRDVEVDTIKAGVVSTPQLAGSAVQQTAFQTTTANITVPYSSQAY